MHDLRLYSFLCRKLRQIRLEQRPIYYIPACVPAHMHDPHSSRCWHTMLDGSHECDGVQDDLVSGLNVIQGQVCEKKHLKEDLEQLQQLGLFSGVTGRVVPVHTGSKRMRVELRFSEEVYPPIKSVRVSMPPCRCPPLLRMLADACHLPLPIMPVRCAPSHGPFAACHVLLCKLACER